MTLREQLIAAFETFVSHSRMGQRRLSTILFGSGVRFDQILAGSDFSTGTFERAMKWLSDNWPENAAWPQGVDRPEPTVPEAAE